MTKKRGIITDTPSSPKLTTKTYDIKSINKSTKNILTNN